MRKMRENLLWATGYNALAISIAARVLMPWGITLRPEFGTLIMSANPIIVVINALLLRNTILENGNNPPPRAHFRVLRNLCIHLLPVHIYQSVLKYGSVRVSSVRVHNNYLIK
jgi:hypothetical protein